jgi:hypothetical protein
MPYKSEAQRKWAHTKNGMKALGKEGVKEFDEASKGKKLPKKIDKSKTVNKKTGKEMSNKGKK